MEYLVSLFTRPLSYAMLLPSVASSSDGKDHLRHWGVLVSDMTLLDLEVLLSRTRELGAKDNTVFGTMYELYRMPDDKNTVSINTEFSMESLRNDWPMFAMAFVGKTTLSHTQIKDEGIETS
jgi:hypothetical protein